jgi:leader peptidase (prepilin peptidase)/N-methyltransferase
MTLLGLCVGSFANVVIYRLPHGLSVVRPRSRCPGCEKPIAWFDNIPVLSWLLLWGRCRSCRASISWRYPLVEALIGGLFFAVFWRYGWAWSTLEYLWLVFGLVVVSFIDFDHMILPDRFTLSGIALGLVGAWLNPEREFMPAFLGFLIGGGFLWAVAYVYYAWRHEEGMGGGDIKLLAWIGAVLGWTSVPFVILSASLAGSLVGLLLAWRSSAGLKTSLPFGPYIALGALIYLLGGDTLADWYWELFMPLPGPAN